MTKEYPALTPYQFASNCPIWFIDIDGLEGGPSNQTASPFMLGKPIRPNMQYDNGFLQAYPGIGYVPNPRKPSFGDYASYTYWNGKVNAAKVFRPDLSDATAAYKHFLSASGSSFVFNFKSYLKDDASGQLTLQNAQSLIQENASNMLKTSGSIQFTSDAFSAGSTDARFPYPATENWQKAIGAFNFWVSGDITATAKDGVLTYSATFVLHGDDMYNFNPGMQDIATGTPDADNGVFELTGLAKQFMQTGTATYTMTWSVNQQSGTSTNASTDNRMTTNKNATERANVREKQRETRASDKLKRGTRSN